MFANIVNAFMCGLFLTFISGLFLAMYGHDVVQDKFYENLGCTLCGWSFVVFIICIILTAAFETAKQNSKRRS